MEPDSPLVDLVADHDAAPAPRRPWTVGLLILVSIATFAAAAATLHRFLPGPPELLRTQKEAFFDHRRAAFDTVLVGASTVYRQVDPAVFDELLAAGGVSARTFNLGIPGLSAIEALQLLHWLLDRDEPPKRVLLELRGHPLVIEGANRITDHFQRWHDLPTTWRALTIAAEAEADSAWKLDYGLASLKALGGNLGNVGVLRRILADRLAGTAEGRAARREALVADRRFAMGARGDGFVTLDRAAALAPDPVDRRRFQRRNESWRERQQNQIAQAQAERKRTTRRLETVEGAVRAAQALTPSERTLLEEIVALARARDVELTFFVGPELLGSAALLPVARREGVIDHLLLLDDHARYPRLFDPAVWFDHRHLSADGAAVYTPLLAAAYLEHRVTRIEAP